MKQFTYVILIVCLSMTSAFAQKKVAVVKLLRGDVDVLTLGKTTKLKMEDWVEDGSVVKTAEKSFVKLIFTDKSQMNIGPSSEMKIEKFNGKDSGVIDLVKGKIRSQVTKDYLQMDQNKSKLFIKTPNAVMGVRGTDFMIATNGLSTSTVLFEGSISFNKLENRSEANTNNLEDIVNRGVNIRPGEFSVMDNQSVVPTLPSVLNVQQREKLEKNESFDADRIPGNTEKTEAQKSVVPEGLNGAVVSNDTSVLKTEVGSTPSAGDTNSKPSAGAAGFIEGDKFKPANGSFLHVDSGVIIAPPPDSVFDPNTNTYIPTNSGSVATTGDYIPPKNMEITSDGKVLVMKLDEKGQMVVQKVDRTLPVISVTSAPSSQGDTQLVVQTPAKNSDHPINDQGGLSGYSNIQRNTSGGLPPPGTSGQLENGLNTKTTIIVKPQ